MTKMELVPATKEDAKKTHTYISDTWELIVGKIKDMQKQPACVKYSYPPCLPAFPG